MALYLRTADGPCRFLSVSDLHTLGIDDPDRRDPGRLKFHPGCAWARDADTLQIIVIPDQDGLTGMYGAHHADAKAYAYFEPAAVAGYPGVFAQNVDERSLGFCELDIGVTDSITVNFIVGGLENKGQCYRKARAEVAMVLRNIGPS